MIIFLNIVNKMIKNQIAVMMMILVILKKYKKIIMKKYNKIFKMNQIKCSNKKVTVILGILKNKIMKINNNNKFNKTKIQNNNNNRRYQINNM